MRVKKSRVSLNWIWSWCIKTGSLGSVKTIKSAFKPHYKVAAASYLQYKHQSGVLMGSTEKLETSRKLKVCWTWNTEREAGPSSPDMAVCLWWNTRRAPDPNTERVTSSLQCWLKSRIINEGDCDSKRYLTVHFHLSLSRSCSWASCLVKEERISRRRPCCLCKSVGRSHVKNISQLSESTIRPLIRNSLRIFPKITHCKIQIQMILFGWFDSRHLNEAAVWFKQKQHAPTPRGPQPTLAGTTRLLLEPATGDTDGYFTGVSWPNRRANSPIGFH